MGVSMRLDHIQLALPRDSEDTCREFWVGCLQFKEIEKPENLKLRGGAWFRKEAVEIHLAAPTQHSTHLGLRRKRLPEGWLRLRVKRDV